MVVKMSEDMKSSSPSGEKKSVKRHTSAKNVTQDDKKVYSQKNEMNISFGRRRVWPD